jgi:hypothetical protein
MTSTDVFGNASVSALIGAIAGGGVGFGTSLYFWYRSRKLQMPRLVAKRGNIAELHKIEITLFNDGYSDAEDGIIRFPGCSEGSFNYLKPSNAISYQFESIDPQDIYEHKKQLIVEYADVWGSRHAQRWSIVGEGGDARGEYPTIGTEIKPR